MSPLPGRHVGATGPTSAARPPGRLANVAGRA